MTTDSRADRFVRELGELKIPDPAAGRPQLWVRLGVVLMVAGAALAVTSYAMSHGTRDPLVQRDAITLGLGGVTAAVAGAALFLRYSLTGFLRFWMARQSFDLAVLGDRIIDPAAATPAVAPAAAPQAAAPAASAPAAPAPVAAAGDKAAAKETVAS
ncbi:hypothetical protein CcI49_03850 [Frankia sp. CcI49]|uniref:hypothetical protein n=1 Tax=unclassified Frankia TaxID=2632575 RepID=UPI0006CA1669|nr:MULTISPECIES: hypothetical protein [unclassified Frankia]KPM53985.1 hypothetical protein ACG83_18100 [Frankia sp. R43]ONH61934.1 hypothetical protein CcI49_03850 [Frankia sp. CcI49]